jgi:CMP-N,N'-diacetyllegionaminic acid synthase
MATELVYALIPARSGSKGVKDKNIRKVVGKELLAYSIEFAQRLNNVERIIVSTDSRKYANIARGLGAEVPFLRSPDAARDDSMEEDVLLDLRNSFLEYGMEEPDIIVWLRPTFIFRNVDHVQKAVDALLIDPTVSAARTIVQSESRLYRIEENRLSAVFDDKGKDMLRRQEVENWYSVFSADVFRFRGRPITKRFLGENILPVITDKICGFDIDDEVDLMIAEELMKRIG